MMVSTASCTTANTSEQTKNPNNTVSEKKEIDSNLVLKDLWSIDALQGQFMQDHQTPRLILLFSPNWGVCRNGARAVQTILTKNPDIDVAVYTIWFRGYRGGSREAWPKELLTDKRVTHYWDEQDIVGTWFAKQGENIGLAARDGIFLWDAFLLFSRDSIWEEYPNDLQTGSSPVMSSIKLLQESLLSMYQ